MVYGALLGALSSLALTAVLYLGQQLANLPLVPFDLFDQLTRVLPGGLITLFIETMVKAIRGLDLGETDAVAKLIEQLMGIAMTTIIGAAFGAGLAWAVRRKGMLGWWAGMLAGIVLFLLVAVFEFNLSIKSDAVLTILWLGTAMVGWGAILGGLVDTATLRPGMAAESGYNAARRAFMARTGAAALGLALGTFGLGRLLDVSRTSTGAGRPLAVADQLPPAPSTGAAAPPHAGAVPGTRPEITPADDFYRIDINITLPTIDGDSWGLEVEGLFDRPRRLTLAGITALPAETRPYTYSCISNPIAGDLIGTTYWTGVRAPDLMKELGLRPEASGLRVVSADSFTEYVTREDLEDPRTLFVYGMDGKTLPIEHGFPLRIQIPNRYGMKQPKWITRFVAVSKEELGYWVARGWSKEARPQITSVIDTVARDSAQDRKVPVGGIAWAGDRGISKVEVRVDDGSWQEATILTPPLGPLAWVQWRYDWPSSPGKHTFTVRATDGKGVLQTETEHVTHPDGATGYHSMTQTI